MRMPMRQTLHRRGSPRAFTLVELLVVIGIIALLISIIMPSLALARRHGQAVSCQSNVRQIGIAALMYANETKRYVAYVPPAGGNPARDRKELLYPFLLQGQNNDDNAGNQVWHCPANDKVDVEASYGFNTNLNGIRITRVRRSSETVALCDAGLADGPPAGGPSLATHCWPPGRPASSGSCRPNHLRHPKKRVSVAFVDGHAESLAMEPPFYPGPVGTYTPTNVANPDAPDYQDKLWDLN